MSSSNICLRSLICTKHQCNISDCSGREICIFLNPDKFPIPLFVNCSLPFAIYNQLFGLICKMLTVEEINSDF